MTFVGIEFVRCSSCDREVRLWAAPVAQQISARLQLTEDAAVSTPEGTFECPFCGVAQEVANVEPRRVAAACVICGKETRGDHAMLVSPSEQHMGTHQFYVHPACLKKVAKPGFAGLDRL
jgi:hypothetical protein